MLRIIADPAIRAFDDTVYGVWLMLLPATVGTIFFIPCWRNFFTSPRVGQYSARRSKRSVLGVFLLTMLFPLYAFYWIYKVHAELRSDHPELDIPRAGGALAVSLVPMAYVVLLYQLRSELCRKGTVDRQTWPLIVAAVLFPAVTLARVQSDLNHLSVDE